MERREHYDPEDIESLLQERGFDELLEEERAYVLRHLSGRAEYEAMRALLYQVRDDERMHPPLQADPDVKNAVMAAFRAQQRPQWSIWLNSVGALLWPKEMSAMWRPALALASIAVLVVVGMQVTRNAGSTAPHSPLAELKEAPKPAPASGSTVREEAPSERVNAPTENLTLDAPEKTVSVQESMTEAAAAAEAPPPPAPMDAQREDMVADEVNFNEDLAAGSNVEKKAESDGPVSLGSATITELSHQVTDLELARNMSTANATGQVTRVAVAKERAYFTVTTAGAAVTNSPELLALLNTGW